ncbi:hypothetical protein BTO30_02450 [Domibacillus antri]|uniref:Uncharacterized protein n=1 Tax=Domibacillus antri TaxID=1714264 RepID=A0A1Q8Q990_9BACI|nr:YisL family protein [Domibacillus antri]OLN23825.1 hypothetical protein BTO30_02450 [Domibacillus antri]
MDFLTSNTHLHITTWAVAVILFLVAVTKPSKGVHMALRLFYVLILISGLLLFIQYNSVDPMMYGLKMLGGILTIGLMEMTLVRKKKGKGTGGVLIGAIVLLLITIYLGFDLPVGF